MGNKRPLPHFASNSASLSASPVGLYTGNHVLGTSVAFSWPSSIVYFGRVKLSGVSLESVLTIKL